VFNQRFLNAQLHFADQAAGQQPLFPKRRRIDHGDAQRQPSPGINRQSSVSFDLNLPGGPRRDPFRPRAKLEPDVSEHTIEPVRSSHPVPRPTPSAVSLEVNLPADRRDPLAPRRRQPEPRSGEDIPMMTPRKVQFRSPIRDDTPQHIREARQTLAMEGRSSVGVSRHDVAPFVLEGRVNAEDEDEEMQDPLASSPIRSFESTPSPQVTFDPKGPPIVVIQRSSPTRSRQGRQVEEREVGDMEIDELPDEGNVTKGKSPERAGEGVVAVTAAILVGAGEGRKPQVEGEEVIAETGTLGTEATDVKRGLRQERAEAQGEEQTREREAGIPDWLPPGERVDRPMDTVCVRFKGSLCPLLIAWIE
jgi:hypothetical protein